MWTDPVVTVLTKGGDCMGDMGRADMGTVPPEDTGTVLQGFTDIDLRDCMVMALRGYMVMALHGCQMHCTVTHTEVTVWQLDMLHHIHRYVSMGNTEALAGLDLTIE